ncbi:mitochondrial inheritance and actin cytoskeleton organization protein [Scheffersomyces coipomensis]|uniref:mitochondrial inheritance and actin cytoskeleton organization protein n=1 Tax=Scheffersomyces coipomensis TaxID=1788519 RepID=UPI00315C5E16
MSKTDNEIIELIERGNYALAQSQLSKQIKKFPQRSYYYALNNEILSKKGETDQAIQNNLKLIEKIPNDRQTLQTLWKFFDEHGMEKESNVIFENSIKKYPINSESIILDWFQMSINKFNLRLFNKIFINLHKSNKDNRIYSFWLAFSYYLLIENHEALKVSDKELSLFKPLSIKILDDNLKPFKNTQELFVYLKLLSLSDKNDEILTTLEEYKASSVFNFDLDLNLMYLETLNVTENWSKLSQFSEHLLFQDKFDDFDTWKLWIKSNFQLNTSSTDLISKINSYQIKRNSSIALIHISKTYGLDIFQPIASYYTKFNHKLCCFYDLKGYLSEIDTTEFISEVDNSTISILETSSNSINDLIKLINNQKFWFLLSKDSELTEFNSLNWKIYNLYKVNESIRGGEFDNNPLNELLLISIIVDLSNDSSIKNIVKNIYIINNLLQEDKYNHKLKLWLMKLYSNLNANDLSLEIYQSMNIKMIQHETLSHYIIPLNPSKQHLSDLVNIYRFYLTSDKEIESNIFEGFEKGVFNKLQSFINFGKRLSNSVSRNFIISNIIKHSIVLGDTSYMNYFTNLLKNTGEAIVQNDMIDNRDFNSEWKFGLLDADSKHLNQDLLNVPINSQQINPTIIKLNILKYLIMFETKDEIIQKYLKLYNKFISNYKPKLAFDVLLSKINHNILKLFKGHMNANELNSALNFIVKNFKLDKMKSSLVPASSILSWELSHNLTNLIELIQITSLFLKSSKGHKSWQEIKNCLDDVISELKKFKFKFKETQIQQLNELNSSLEISELDIDVRSSAVVINDSIVASADPLIKVIQNLK